MNLKEAAFTPADPQWRVTRPLSPAFTSTVQDEYAGSGWSFTEVNIATQRESHAPAVSGSDGSPTSIRRVLDALTLIVFVYAVTIVGFYVAGQRGAAGAIVAALLLLVGVGLYAWNRRA